MLLAQWFTEESDMAQLCRIEGTSFDGPQVEVGRL